MSEIHKGLDKRYTHYENWRKQTVPISPGSPVEQYFQNDVYPEGIAEPLPASWMEVDLSAIDHNVEAIARRVQGQAGIIGVGKYDFMGLGGGKLIPERVMSKGVEQLALANVDEAMQLRAEGFNGSMLLLYPLTDQHLQSAIQTGAELTITSYEQARKIAEIAGKNKLSDVKVHLKVATGFNHYKAVSPEEAVDIMNGLQNFPNITVEGLCSHFATAGDDPEMTKREFENFMDVVKVLGENGHFVPTVHMANSAALTLHPDTWNPNVYNHFMPGTKPKVRPGGLIYGLYGDPANTLNLESALNSVVSHIADIDEIEEGEHVGYCAAYTAPGKMNVATIPAGWGSGYTIENQGDKPTDILINGKRSPIVGLVGASSFAVRSPENSRLGQRVTLIGKEGDEEITSDEIATNFGFLNTQLTLSLGRGMQRVYTERQ